MVRAPWLGDVLTDEGLKVRPYQNPIGVGKEMAAIHGVVDHDTVTSTGWTNAAVRHLLRWGRPGLSGPLAQLGLDRGGVFDWIADGRCNHNGYGEWGNNSIGIEVYCNGGGNPKERWSGLQEEMVARANAAILRHLNKTEAFAKGHKETDWKRKIDPWNVSMPQVRARTRAYLLRSPAPKVPELEEILNLEEDMAKVLYEKQKPEHNYGKAYLVLTGGGQLPWARVLVIGWSAVKFLCRLTGQKFESVEQFKRDNTVLKVQLDAFSTPLDSGPIVEKIEKFFAGG